MYSAIERMDICEYFTETVIEPSRERIARTVFGNKCTTAERITQIMDDCKFSCQNR